MSPTPTTAIPAYSLPRLPIMVRIKSKALPVACAASGTPTSLCPHATLFQGPLAEPHTRLLPASGLCPQLLFAGRCFPWISAFMGHTHPAHNTQSIPTPWPCFVLLSALFTTQTYLVCLAWASVSLGPARAPPGAGTLLRTNVALSTQQCLSISARSEKPPRIIHGQTGRVGWEVRLTPSAAPPPGGVPPPPSREHRAAS